MSSTGFRGTPPHAHTGRAPKTVQVLGAVALIILIGPVIALALRVPWSEFTNVLTQWDTIVMLNVSLSAAVWSTAVTMIVGIPLAVWIQHLKSGARAARLLVLLPLALPPVVSGLALTAVIGQRGLLAPVIDALGWEFAFHFPGVVASHVFVSLPFVVVSVDSALRQIDKEILASAAGIGLTPWQILTKITLPTIVPSIFTGAGLAFARSLGEFGTTITFAGSMPGVTRTMSLGIYLERELNPDRAYVLSAILIVLAIIVIALANLPGALRREPKPAPRAIGDINAARLSELTAPVSAPASVGVRTGLLDVTFPAGRTTAVVGANGSGKSTLMGQVAGRTRGAEVLLGDTVVDGGRFVPPHKRGVALLTQKPGLPRAATVRKALTMATRDDERTVQLLDAAGLSVLADVPVPALSGGQAAQVALLRALAVRPSLLVLDEPLAAVDVASAAKWRSFLQETGGDRTLLLITHDPLDVATLSDELLVLDSGRAVAHRETDYLLQVPPTQFVADIAGLNVLPATVTAISGEQATAKFDGGDVTGRTVGDSASGAAVTATVSPRSCRLASQGESLASTNAWTGTVRSVEAADAESARVTVIIGRARLVVPIERAELSLRGLRPGDTVTCTADPGTVTLYPQTR